VLLTRYLLWRFAVQGPRLPAKLCLPFDSAAFNATVINSYVELNQTEMPFLFLNESYRKAMSSI
jgi:hypothetical protein